MPEPAVLRTEGITKVYRTGEVAVHALRGVDFELRRGELIVLVGRLRTVERGRHTGLEAEIRGGLEPGDRVVRYPSDAVADGTRVTER